MDLVDSRKGIWKSAPGKGRKTPKGRQVVELASQQVRELIGELPRLADLLIELSTLNSGSFWTFEFRTSKCLGGGDASEPS